MKSQAFFFFSKVKNYFLLFFICFIYTTAFSQEKDLDNLYIEKLKSHSNNDSILFYARKLKNSSNPCNEYIGKINEINVYYRKGEYDFVETALNTILEELKDSDLFCQKVNQISALNRLFWIKKNESKLNEGFELLIKRLKIVESFPEKNSYYFIHKLSVESNMASIKYELGLFNEVIDILKRANYDLSKLSLNPDDKYYYFFLKHKSSNLNIIGDAFWQLHQLDSTKVYYGKAYEITKFFKPKRTDSKTLYNIRIANTLIRGEKFREALQLIDKQDIKTVPLKIKQDVHFLKAFSYQKIQNGDSAIYYSRAFLNLKEGKSGAKKNRIAIYNILASEYDKKNIIDSAYKYSELAFSELKVYNNSKSNATKSSYIYDFKEVNKLHQSILEKEEAVKNRLILYFSIAILMLSYFLYFAYSKRKQLRKKYASTLKSIENKISPKKKEYAIDASLEEKVLKELLLFEESTLFLDSDFNINKLAKKLKTNTSYLSSIINEKKGKPFKQYIAELRINYLIKQLGKNPTLKKYTIKALAEEIGYTNASAFTRAFKKHTGKTPSGFLNDID
jgi:AraC-like DNA-binding protein